MDITLPAPPIQSGYIWRPLQHADAPTLYQLELDCARVDGNTNPPTLLACERKLEHAASRLVTDTLCAINAVGQLAVSARLTFDLDLKHECRAFLDGGVHPDYRARGLGDFILRWMQARARQVFSAIADDRPRVLRIDLYDKGADAIALYEQHGFRFAFAEDEMRRDLRQSIPPNLLPDGMSFVHWTPQNATLFFKVYDDAFRERPGFPAWSEQTWRRAFTEHGEFRDDLSHLILDGREPVAYALCAVVVVESDEGWILQMGVRPAWRKRGLASALLSEVMRSFQAEGLPYAWLSVNVDNPQAKRVYQRLGFVCAKRYTSFRKTIGARQ
jgi:mycothiol synthase